MQQCTLNHSSNLFPEKKRKKKKKKHKLKYLRGGREHQPFGLQRITQIDTTMVSSYILYHTLSFALIIGLVSSSTTFLSDNIFDSQGSNSRSLLQAKKTCTIDFEAQNYTIITSQCKGPQYPPKACCQSFKEFACPFADALNDEQSDCATTMFSYINLYGKYPPGIFALQCREGKEGLECADIVVTNKNVKSRAHISAATPPTFVLLFATFFVLIYHLF